MNAIADSKTVPMVELAVYADLARIALDTLNRQRAYFRTRDREAMKVARDYEARLDRKAREAIELFNATPGLFADAELEAIR